MCWEIAEGTRDKMLANTWQAPKEREPLAIIIIDSFPGLTMVISSGQVVNALATPTNSDHYYRATCHLTLCAGAGAGSG